MSEDKKNSTTSIPMTHADGSIWEKPGRTWIQVGVQSDSTASVSGNSKPPERSNPPPGMKNPDFRG